MPTAKKRVSTSTTVQKLSIDQVHSLLQDLPEKQKESLTLREAVQQLQVPITSALKKGYSLEEIVAMLAEKEIKITLSSLRYYLTRMKKDNAESTPKRTRKPSSRKSDPTPKGASQNGFVTVDAPAPEVEPAQAQTAPKTRAKRGQKAQEPQSLPTADLSQPEPILAEPAKKATRSTRTRSKTAAKAKSEPRTKAKSQPAANPEAKTTSTRGRRKAKAAS